MDAGASLEEQEGLKIAFLNIVSLRKHRNELSIILHDNDIDIIGLSETQFDENIGYAEVSIEGYKIFRNDRNTYGGGVAIYVKNTLPEPKIKQNSNKIELLSLEIKKQNARPFFSACWYRPPTSGVDETAFNNLREPLGDLDKERKEIILVGDTNCDFKNNSNANTKN